MGRKKINPKIKKGKLSITISQENFNKFKELEIKNKSKIINWLLDKHFNEIEGDQK